MYDFTTCVITVSINYTMLSCIQCYKVYKTVTLRYITVMMMCSFKTNHQQCWPCKEGLESFRMDERTSTRGCSLFYFTTEHSVIDELS